MALINDYHFTENTGTSLTDRVGVANGTITGATWNANGYLSFVGGHEGSYGNWNRVNFAHTTFDYNATSNFTLILIFKTTATVVGMQEMYLNGDIGVFGWQQLRVPSTEYAQTYLNSSVTHVDQSLASTITINDGKWHILILNYPSATRQHSIYLDSKLYATAATPYAAGAGNFYSTGICVLGTSYYAVGGGYCYDFTGDICRFSNYNSTLTVADVQNISNEFNNLI